MKTPLLLALVGLAITFALPTFAQQTKTPDPQLRETLVALVKKYDEAFNKNDAAALTALFTEEAIFVTDTGPVNGREDIEKYWVDRFKQFHHSNEIVTVDENSPHVIGTAGNEMWANGEWSLTLQERTGDPIPLKGYWAEIYVREGDAWKVRMQMWNITPPPAETKVDS